MQLAAGVKALGHFFGRPVKQGPVEFISAEDSADELHRRLADIAREAGRPLRDFDGLHITSLADEDAVMAVLQEGRGTLVETGLYRELDDILTESKPALLVLDTLADVFGGNEIVRQQVRAFINMLRRLAIRHNTTVLVLAHPSLSGMSSGKGTSGSTGWSNSVRSRLYLERIYDDDGHEPDEDARVLRVMKSNYGRVGAEIPMRWQRGVFVPLPVSMGGDPLMAQVKAERVFLELLAKARAQNINVHVMPGKGYAPDHFRADAAKQGVSYAELVVAMKRLLDNGKIINALYGPPSRERHRLQLAGGA
jgi:RecA-family ATPase